MNHSVFGVERPEDSPGLLLWQTTVIWQRCIKKALDEYGVAHAQFVILAILLWFTEKKQVTTQALIVRQSKLDKMTVSKALKKLAAQGFVKRAEHTEDTRAKSVQLTAKGKAFALKLVPVVEAIDAAFFGAVDKTKQRTLAQLLNQIIIKSTDSFEH